jgi:hypothetical protein
METIALLLVLLLAVPLLVLASPLLVYVVPAVLLGLAISYWAHRRHARG